MNLGDVHSFKWELKSLYSQFFTFLMLIFVPLVVEGR